MDPRERSRIYNGASDAFSRAMELVATPLIFGFLGHLLDVRVGTAPVFTVAFSVLCLAYLSWKICMAYQADMERHEAERRAKGSRRPAPSRPRALAGRL